MTIDERVEKMADEIIANIQTDVDYFRRCIKGKCGDFKYNFLVPLIATEIQAAVEEATAKNRAEIETLIWNLAGCSTFALGYGLDESWDKEKARAAMHDVHKLAIRYRTAKAEAYEDAAKIADEVGVDSEEGREIARRIRTRAKEVGK